MANSSFGKAYYASIADIGANMSPLWSYIFAGVGGAATLTGYFTNVQGRQVSPLVTLTIPTADGAAFSSFDDVTLVVAGGPATFDLAEAVGFYGALTGADIYMGLSLNRNDTNTIAPEAPQAGYPVVPQANFIAFGRTS